MYESIQVFLLSNNKDMPQFSFLGRTSVFNRETLDGLSLKYWIFILSDNTSRSATTILYTYITYPITKRLCEQSLN